MSTPETTALVPAQSTGPIAIVPRTFDEAVKMAEYLSASALVPAFCRKQPHAVFAMVAAGAEMGLAPMASLRALYVQVDRDGSLRDGVPRMYADAMVAVCKARPDLCEYFYPVEQTPDRATWATKRKGDPTEVRRSWDMERAKKAGLWGKGGPWTAHPQRMFSARAKAELAKDVYPDLVGGFMTPEEADDIIDVVAVDTSPSAFTRPPEPEKPAKKKPETKSQGVEAVADKALKPEPAKTPEPMKTPPKEPEVVDAEIVEERKGPAPAAAAHYDASAKRVAEETSAPNPNDEDGFGDEGEKGDASEPETMQRFRVALAAVKAGASQADELLKVKREFVPWSNTPEGKPFADTMKKLFAQRQHELREGA